jgi:hypothetical protein
VIPLTPYFLKLQSHKINVLAGKTWIKTTFLNVKRRNIKSTVFYFWILDATSFKVHGGFTTVPLHLYMKFTLMTSWWNVLISVPILRTTSITLNCFIVYTLLVYRNTEALKTSHNHHQPINVTTAATQVIHIKLKLKILYSV